MNRSSDPLYTVLLVIAVVSTILLLVPYLGISWGKNSSSQHYSAPHQPLTTNDGTQFKAPATEKKSLENNPPPSSLSEIEELLGDNANGQN